MEKAYKNISYLFGAVLLLVFAAFFKTYFGLFPKFAGTAFVVHFHAISILLWFAMLISQPIFIRLKRVELHRFIGKASYVLVPLLIFSCVLMAQRHQLRDKNLGIFTVNIFDLSLFLLFYGLAIWYRRIPAYHARFMILTVLPFLDPALGRLPQFYLPAGLLQLAIISGFLLYERFHRKVYKPYVISLLVVLGLYVPLICLFLFGQPVLNALWDVCFG